MYDLFKDKTIDKEAQNILTAYITEAQNIKNEIVNIFNNEKAVIPIAFDERDIIREAPPLFDDIFQYNVSSPNDEIKFWSFCCIFSYVIYERSSMIY